MDRADGAVYRREVRETTFTCTLDEFHFPFLSFLVFLCMRFVNLHFPRGGVEDSHVQELIIKAKKETNKKTEQKNSYFLS